MSQCNHAKGRIRDEFVHRILPWIRMTGRMRLTKRTTFSHRQNMRMIMFSIRMHSRTAETMAIMPVILTIRADPGDGSFDRQTNSRSQVVCSLRVNMDTNMSLRTRLHDTTFKFVCQYTFFAQIKFRYRSNPVCSAPPHSYSTIPQVCLSRASLYTVMGVISSRHDRVVNIRSTGQHRIRASYSRRCVLDL